MVATKEKKSLVNRDNYVVVQGWMITDLKLKGNELLLYAVIYGFSQLEGQKFTGSLQYLADWTNSTKQGVMKCLKSLEAKGLIAKKDTYINKVKFCEYQATKFNGVSNKVDGGIKQSLTGGSQQSLTNNLELYNQEDTLEETQEDKLDKDDKEGDSIPNEPISLEELKKRKSPQLVEFIDTLVEERIKTELVNRGRQLKEEDSVRLEPSAFTKRLIKAGYISSTDLNIPEYNDFFADLVQEVGDWELVRNAVQYFAKTCNAEMRKGITDRLAYLQTSIRAGVQRQQNQAKLYANLYPFGAV